MAHFSQQSLIKLRSTHSDLQRLFLEVVKTFDCTVLCGHRNQTDQNKAFKEGKSKLQYPMSKHNMYPSAAVDVASYPLNWEDTARFYYFAGYVMRVADEMGFQIRWGGDWDKDKKMNDQSFNDLVHFELISKWA